VSPAKIPNTIGYNLLGFAVGPLFWNPLSKVTPKFPPRLQGILLTVQTIGRRTVYLMGSILFIPCAVWMALSPSYTVFCAARVVAGLISSWSQTVPPATIADIFVKEVHGSKMSMFAVGVVIAPPIAPIFCGLVVTYHTWPVLFWIITGMACFQLALFFLIVPETLWVEDESGATSEAPPPASIRAGSNIEAEVDAKASEQHFEHSPVRTAHVRSGHNGVLWYPWQRPAEFLHIFLSPITMLRFISITIPSIYYGSIFAWSVGMTIVFPQKFEGGPNGIKLIPMGAMFLAFGVGGLLGKWSGGIVGDKTVSYLERRMGYRQPEHRLWALVRPLDSQSNDLR
jgi:MFS family permease